MSSISLKLTRAFAASVVLSIVLISVQMITAQETRGTIRGTVTDPNGGAVANANVQIVDPSRGSKVNLTTNSDGLYTANYLIPGTYQIVVEAAGFKKTLRDNVLVPIGASIHVDVPLEV